jgi:hypothetical protein
MPEIGAAPGIKFIYFISTDPCIDSLSTEALLKLRGDMFFFSLALINDP